jgi:hypothetical protein
MALYYYGSSPTGTDEDVPRKRIEATRFQEIPVHVELLVRFDLARPPNVVKRGAE